VDFSLGRKKPGKDYFVADPKEVDVTTQCCDAA